tara:strand:+ start:749 stop:1000 length:252 start_codon:yes stop_codon:yes gene_type:complete
MKKRIPKRFQKSQYTTVNKSLLHQWLKEEGYNRQGLSLDFECTPMTIDRYMDNPDKLKLSQVHRLCIETGVDANFIMSLVYEN